MFQNQSEMENSRQVPFPEKVVQLKDGLLIINFDPTNYMARFGTEIP